MNRRDFITITVKAALSTFVPPQLNGPVGKVLTSVIQDSSSPIPVNLTALADKAGILFSLVSGGGRWEEVHGAFCEEGLQERSPTLNLKQLEDRAKLLGSVFEQTLDTVTSITSSPEMNLLHEMSKIYLKSGQMKDGNFIKEERATLEKFGIMREEWEEKFDNFPEVMRLAICGSSIEVIDGKAEYIRTEFTPESLQRCFMKEMGGAYDTRSIWRSFLDTSL